MKDQTVEYLKGVILELEKQRKDENVFDKSIRLKEKIDNIKETIDIINKTNYLPFIPKS